MLEPFLQGTRVVDLSQYIPGPYASLMFADLGADVVKVEPPTGDPMRTYGAPSPNQVSPFYAVTNGGKRVVHLDLKSPEDHGFLLAILRAADVLIESYRPGVLDRLRLGADELMTANPRLIHCSISSFGQTGPLAGKGAHDVNCMALSGGLELSGTVERPVITTPPVADYASSLQAALTIMAALISRLRTGKGAFIDLSMTDTVLGWQSWLLTDALRGGPIAKRGSGDSGGGLASYNIYETADGRFISIGADEEKFWQRFCLAVGHEEWVGRKTEPSPQSGLIAEVRKVIASHDLAYWNNLLGKVDCCYAPVLQPKEVIDHPQIVARKVIAESDDGGPVVEVLYPAWIDGQPPPRRAPYLQTDAAAVLRSWAAST